MQLAGAFYLVGELYRTSLSYFNNQCNQLKTSEIRCIKTRLLSCKNIELEISKCASLEALILGEQHLDVAVILRSLSKYCST